MVDGFVTAGDSYPVNQRGTAVTVDTMALLEEAARKAPRSTIEAATRVLRASAEPEQGAFLARALNALVRLAPAIGRRALGDAVGAPSDFDVLYRALSRPEAIAVLGATDPLAGPCAQGLGTKERLLRAEGGTVSASEAARLLGISRQAVDKRRRAGRLIGLPLGRRGYAYPCWQFRDGRTLPGLEAVLSDLSDYDPWMQAIFMLGGNDRLDGDTPLARLRHGEAEAVGRAARAYGEQGAS
jgi:hypothetical protein